MQVILRVPGDGTMKNREARVDNKGVYCKKASTLGYGKTTAKAGDLVSWRYSGEVSEQHGRSLGRIAWAEELQSRANPDKKPVVGFIAVLVFSSTNTFGYIRWIDPDDVTAIRDWPHDFMQFMNQPKLPSYAWVNAAVEHGSMADHYIAKYAKENA